MRFLVLSSLFYTLLLCFVIFSTEGKSNSKHPAKPRKGKFCCFQVLKPGLRTQKGHRVRICKPCKFKTNTNHWVVPGALPQV